jgi:hypothetical protein
MDNGTHRPVLVCTGYPIHREIVQTRKELPVRAVDGPPLLKTMLVARAVR